MTDKEYLEKRMQLNMYRDTVRKLGRRQEELQRLQDLSLRSTSGAYGYGRPGEGNAKDRLGGVASTAISLQEECQSIEQLVVQLRQELCRCVALVPESIYRETLESIYLVGKTLEQLADGRSVTLKTARRWVKAAVVQLDSCSDFFA